MKKPLLSLLALLAMSGAALAHAHLKSVEVQKTAPQAVRLTFTEAVDAKVSTFEVDAGTVRVDTGVKTAAGTFVTIGLKPDLKPGSYVVKWKVMAADDGHVTHGETPFKL